MNDEKCGGVALVTGASRGIGKAIAQRLSRSGRPVALVARSQEGLHELATELIAAGGRAEVFVCDLCDRAGTESLVPAVRSRMGEVSVLVNNAGYGGPFEPLDQVQDTTWEAVFHTNVRALFQLCRATLPSMRARGWGRVINIASVQGAFGAPGSSTYVASKHAVIGYSKAIAAEWGAFGITCNAIAAGYIETVMLSQYRASHSQVLIERIPSRRIGRPDEVAAFAAFLCGAESEYFNGAVIALDGGLTADLGIPGQ